MSDLYDRVIIEFQKDGNSVGSGMIDKKDIDTLVNLHDQTLEQIIGDLAKTLENAITERSKQD
jgi:hypothetical protein